MDYPNQLNLNAFQHYVQIVNFYIPTKRSPKAPLMDILNSMTSVLFYH